LSTEMDVSLRKRALVGEEEQGVTNRVNPRCFKRVNPECVDGDGSVAAGESAYRRSGAGG